VDWEAEDALSAKEGIFFSDEEYRKRILDKCGPSLLYDLDSLHGPQLNFVSSDPVPPHGQQQILSLL